MPEFLHLPPVAQAIVTITGVVLAVVRLLTASRPFWAGLPAWLQKGLPAALVGLGLIPPALEHAQSWLDVAQAVILAIGAWYTASRGDKRPPVDKDGGPRLERVDSDPKLTREELQEPEPPNAAMTRLGDHAVTWSWIGLLASLGLTLLIVGALLSGCDPRKPPCDEAQLKAIDRDYVAKVAHVCLAKYDTKEECPEFPALQADHRAELRKACPQ